MTKIERVVAYLRANGPSKPDDMLHLGMTKKQVLDALGNGAFRDKCHVAQMHHPRGMQGGRVSIWAYGPGPENAKKEPQLPTPSAPRGEYAWIGPVSSVWDLSLRA